MLAKLRLKDISGKEHELEVYKIVEIKEGKPCRKVIFQNKNGEMKTLNISDSM